MLRHKLIDDLRDLRDAERGLVRKLCEFELLAENTETEKRNKLEGARSLVVLVAEHFAQLGDLFATLANELEPLATRGTGLDDWLEDHLPPTASDQEKDHG